MGCRGGFSRKMQKTGRGGAKIAPPLMKLGLKKTISINTGVDDLLCRGLGGGGQTHSYGGPIFENFFLPERYRKMRWRHCFLFSIFDFFKAIGPK